VNESIRLICTTGTSDKQYLVHLEAAADGYILSAANGPRTGTLTPRPKIATPVPYAQAKKAYDALVRSKIKDGYVPDGNATTLVGSDLEQRSSGITLQLLTPIDPNRVDALMGSDDWCLQRKHDGTRLAVIIDGGSVTGVNRRGLTIPVPQDLADALLSLPIQGRTVIDGEQLGSRFEPFDLLEADGCIRHLSYAMRLSRLATMLAAPPANIGFPTTALTRSHKHELLSALRSQKAEGGVFKQLSAAWSDGRGDTAFKLKFTTSATVVAGEQKLGKRSVAIYALLDDGQPHPVGHCTIPGTGPIPSPGQLLEVGYLYLSGPMGALIQPHLIGIRTDLERADQVSSLKLRGLHEHEEEMAA
jgi:bifunctional non-homologous end joining protein LigD